MSCDLGFRILDNVLAVFEAVGRAVEVQDLEWPS